jgi:hypothetical protein
MENKQGELRELKIFKKELMAKIVATDRIVQLLSNTGEEPFKGALPDQRSEILYRNVFPYMFTGSETQETIESYVMMEFSVGAIGRSYVKIGVLVYFYVNKQKMLVKDEEGEIVLRRDLLAEELFKLCRNENWGLGPLKFRRLEPAYGLGPDFIGGCMIFETNAFQSTDNNPLRPYNPNPDIEFIDDDDEFFDDDVVDGD